MRFEHVRSSVRMPRDLAWIAILAFTVVTTAPRAASAGATGACCFDSGVCVVVDGGLECIEFGGDYQGNGSTCANVDCDPPPPPTGACCLVNGSCAVMTQAACNIQDGWYQDDGVPCSAANCTPIGACCLGTFCVVTTQQTCSLNNGDFFGGGSDCVVGTCTPPPGACCIDGTPCFVTTEVICTTNGGVFFGTPDCDGVPCAPPPCPADITGPMETPDGNVDALDYLRLIDQWGSPCTGSCEADITGPAQVPDGNVDALDFLVLIEQWGSPATCP